MVSRKYGPISQTLLTSGRNPVSRDVLDGEHKATWQYARKNVVPLQWRLMGVGH